MKFGVAPEKVGRLIAPVSNSVSASMRASSRLTVFGAIVTLAARDGGVPCYPIANRQTLAGPIALQACAKLLDSADRLVAENDGKANRQFAFPEMDVGTADARHFGTNQGRPRF